MSIVFYIILFFLGLAIGSFLNVIIWRFEPDNYIFDIKRLSGRSHCLSCHKKLSWYELIPIFSFFIQKGRCLSCKSKISFLYPLVELLSAIFLVLSFYFFSTFYQVYNFSFWEIILILFWFKIFLLFILIFIIDLKFMIIPNEINFLIGLIGIIISILIYFFKTPTEIINFSFLKGYSLIFPSFSNNFLINRLFGAGLIFFIFLLIYFLSKGKGIGFGDVKLALASGLLFGWPDILVVTLLAFLIGGIVGLTLIIFKNKKIKDKIPFGPIYVISALLVIFFGAEILKLYFQIFNFLIF